MAGFCLLALVVGGLAAVALPLLAFVLALAAAFVAGITAALFAASSVGSALMAAIALLAAAQIGYGLGLALLAGLGARRLPLRRVSEPATALPHLPLKK